ncbi:hypothetical protein FHX37_2755 [Haloactinospora alba]|uniref:Uncharacterized protein n=1 Tax=Haloactinospora alba TaxID=405555 RepID=A0A543NLT0_9ACTN|nr:hypothetical protein [Haloactinospora alba]TQN32772.1 hypothetical protein FHX37_2755 [Haloactinospora alba]
MQETVASALAQLARLDTRAAQVAESALGSLAAGQKLEALTQQGVQEFCWYVLPVRFANHANERLFAVQSLGRLFSLLDLDRYARICSSETTREILQAYSASHDTGLAAYRKAMRASGVEPPDLPEMTWGTVLGNAEIEAYEATSASLELAIAVGDGDPQAPGWRTVQERHARSFLTQPDARGRSRLDLVREERVHNWLSSPSHPHRQRLRPLLGQIISGAETPHDAATALAPARRLLDYAEEGIGLTQIGYISPTVVRELCVEFDWSSAPSPPRSETDVVQLIALHKLLRTMRAVRHSGRRMVLTRRGRQLHGDTNALWRGLAESVLDTDGFAQAATETLLGLLLMRFPKATGSHARDEDVNIAEEARVVLAESGWTDDGNGSAPDTQHVRSVLITTTWLLETLGLVVGHDLLEGGGSYQLTKAGRAFALLAIHLSATAPAAAI